MSTLEKLAENFGIPIKDDGGSSSHEGWVANKESRSVEYREMNEHGKLELLVFISIVLFIDKPIEEWESMLINSLRHLEVVRC